jgi:plastocyanin
VSPKLSRLMLVASLVAGFSVVPMLMLGAGASGRGVDASGNKFVGTNGGNSIDAYVGDNVTWHILDGVHTVTPFDQKQWGQNGSGDLDPNTDPPYTATHFDKPGQYLYYCKHHGGGTKDHPTGMWGVINVIDPNAPATTTSTTPPTTSPPDTQPPTTVTTGHPGPGPTATTAPPAGPAAHPPTPTTAPPAPTTTTAKPDKKGNTTTTVTTAPPPINLPAEAIIPNINSNGTATQNGVVAPSSTPQGDAVALIKKKHSDNALKALIALGVGMGAMGIGTAAYKFAHRSSKYFPA